MSCAFGKAPLMWRPWWTTGLLRLKVPDILLHPATTEEIMLFYVRGKGVKGLILKDLSC
jgi:hypothetical protein